MFGEASRDLWKPLFGGEDEDALICHSFVLLESRYSVHPESTSLCSGVFLFLFMLDHHSFTEMKSCFLWQGAAPLLLTFMQRRSCVNETIFREFMWIFPLMCSFSCISLELGTGCPQAPYSQNRSICESSGDSMTLSGHTFLHCASTSWTEQLSSIYQGSGWFRVWLILRVALSCTLYSSSNLTIKRRQRGFESRLLSCCLNMEDWMVPQQRHSNNCRSLKHNVTLWQRCWSMSTVITLFVCPAQHSHRC